MIDLIYVNKKERIRAKGFSTQMDLKSYLGQKPVIIKKIIFQGKTDQVILSEHSFLPTSEDKNINSSFYYDYEWKMDSEIVKYPFSDKEGSYKSLLASMNNPPYILIFESAI